MHFLKIKSLLTEKTVFINPKKIKYVTINEELNKAFIFFASSEIDDSIEVNLEDFLKETGNFL